MPSKPLTLKAALLLTVYSAWTPTSLSAQNLIEDAVTGDDPLLLTPITVTAVGGEAALPEELPGGLVADGARLGLLGNTSLRDAPLNVVSYTRKRIENQQYRTVADVAKSDPSVRTLSSQGGMLDAYSIRGFRMNTGNSGELSLDGMFGIAPTYRVQTGYAERVEILKGPTALINGIAPNGGVGGTINIVPKRAGDEDLTRLTTSFGDEAQLGAHLDFSRRFGANRQFGLRVNGKVQRGDTAIDNQHRDSELGAVAFDYSGDRLRATLDLISQSEDYDAPYRELRLSPGLQWPDAPGGSKQVTHSWEWSKAEDHAAMGRVEYDLTNNVTLYGGVGGGSSTIQRLFGYPVIVNDDGDTTDRVSNFTFKTERWAIDAGVRGTFWTGEVQHKVAAELNHYEDKYFRGANYSAEVLNSNIYAPVANPAVFVEAPSEAIRNRTSQMSGLVLSDTMSLMNDRLLLTLGARYQKIETDSFSRGTGDLQSSYSESAVSPMVGVVVKPWETVSLYANYMEGLSRGAIAPDTASNAGEALKPYVTKQYEIGAKFDNGAIGGSLSAFHISKPSAQMVGSLFTDSGEQTNKGFELSAYGEVAPNLRFIAGAMLLDGEISNSTSGVQDNRPVGTPNFTANVGVEWDAPFKEGLSFTADLTHTGAQYTDGANLQKLPSWTTVDLGIHYQTEISNVPVTFRGQILNVADASYWQSSNAYGMVAQGAPRTVNLSMTMNF